MTTNPGSGANPVSGDDVLKELKQNTLGLIVQRTATLETMQSTRSAKERGLQRERKRLAARLPADSPRLAELDARIQQSQAMSVSLEQQIYQAKTPFPMPDAKVWTVFGSVRGGDPKETAGRTIAFYDERGQRREDLNYVCTDAKGYFSVKSVPNASDKGSVQLRVYDSSGKVLYKDPIQMMPKLGALEYREIILDGTGTCSPPGEQPGTGTGTVNPPGPITEPPVEEESEPLRWTVRGRVTEPGGAPAAGMTVTLWDKDLLFDDRLGQAVTNDRGEYELIYSTDTFRDFLERKPDVYLKVTDRAGKKRAQTRKMYRPEAGQVEIIDITLSK